MGSMDRRFVIKCAVVDACSLVQFGCFTKRRRRGKFQRNWHDFQNYCSQLFIWKCNGTISLLQKICSLTRTLMPLSCLLYLRVPLIIKNNISYFVSTVSAAQGLRAVAQCGSKDHLNGLIRMRFPNKKYAPAGCGCTQKEEASSTRVVRAAARALWK